MAKKGRSENSKKIFEFLREAGVGVGFTYKQVQEALGLGSVTAVTGSVKGLKSNGFVVTYDETVDGVKVKKFALTEAGAKYDLAAEETE